MGKRTCSIEDCTNKYKAKGYCDKHYMRVRRHGSASVTAYYYSLEESFLARTEWRNECLAWVGHTSSYGYGYMWINDGHVMAHRYAWERVNGPIPDGLFIDHMCHNKACVNTSHLRLATNQENSFNRAGPEINSSSGIRNVYRTRGGKWEVLIGKSGKLHYFGVHDKIEEAAAVAEQARKDLFGDYAGRG